MATTSHLTAVNPEDPTTWLQPFIDNAKRVEGYSDVVTRLEKAREKVALLQEEYIEPPKEPMLNPEQKKSLLKELGSKLDRDEVDARTELVGIEHDLGHGFVSAIGFCLQDFHDEFKVLCDFTASVTEKETAPPLEELYRTAFTRLELANNAGNTLGNKVKHLDSVLSEVSKKVYAHKGIAGDLGGARLAAARHLSTGPGASSGSEKEKSQPQGTGGKLGLVILKVAAELSYREEDKNERMDSIKAAYRCARAAEHALSELIRIFGEIAKIHGFDF